MKRIPLLFLILLLMPMAGSALAQSIGLTDAINTLEKPFRATTSGAAAINNFQADFFQQSRLASLDQEQRGRGTVEVRFLRQQGDRVPKTQFRWQYEQPNNQEIVSDGNTLWVYLPDNNQVIQSDVSFTNTNSADDPMTFLTGLGNLTRDFQISWAEPNQDNLGNYILQLQPLRGSALIRKLQITVDRKAIEDYLQGITGRRLPILASTVTDPNDNTTTIEFSNAQVNQAMLAGDFHFILPAGVEVVRPTGKQMGY